MEKMKFLQDENKIKKIIEKIENLDFTKTTVQKIERGIKLLFKGLQMEIPTYPPPFDIYRGRLCSKPINVKEITYPPPEKINEFGRFNNLHESLFYGATSHRIILFELDAKIGDTFIISWRTAGNLTLNHVGFTKECSLQLNSNRSLEGIYKFVESSRNFNEVNTSVYDYLAQKCMLKILDGEEYKYKLTIAIGRKLIGKQPLIHGILYPSIAMNGNADNIVLRPGYVDSNLEFINVCFGKVKAKRSTNVYEIDILDSATKNNIDSSGNISWSNRNFCWKLKKQGEKISVCVRDGKFVAYDADGNEIDPE